MEHIIDKIKIPSIMEKVLNHIDENTDDYLDSYERAWEAASLLYDLSPAILHAYFGDDGFEVDYTQELLYEDAPFEIIPFSYNGSDGLSYTWVNLAPELKLNDYPCVSWAPYERVNWLGDNTAQALSNLLKSQLTDRNLSNISKLSQSEKDQWAKIAGIIDYDANVYECVQNRNKMNSAIKPRVVAHYKYVPTLDGIGVFADNDFFSDKSIDLERCSNLNDYIRRANDLLEQFKPASALVVLKQARVEKGSTKDLIELFRVAYSQLGRMEHVRRVDIWLNRRR